MPVNRTLLFLLLMSFKFSIGIEKNYKNNFFLINLNKLAWKDDDDESKNN
jgi:hypothetical protein